MRPIDEVKAERAARGRAKVAEIRDRRRFTDTVAPTGAANRLVPATADRSVFQLAVKEWSPDLGEYVLKDGAHNSKIGGDVSVGDLAGAKIFTLSFEERVTCPRDCSHWRDCYGNSMNRARRWTYTKELEQVIDLEVRALCAFHDKVLIRLHVLGDFPNYDYIKLWARLLDDLDNLHVFGFTAWKADTPIGRGIARLRAVYGVRFAIRNSGRTGEWGAFTLDFPTKQARVGDAIVCPEQRSAMGDTKKGVHCGNCGACWRSSKPIAFVQH